MAATPRENFVGPGPWTISVNPWSGGQRRVTTPGDDPALLYSNALIALDDQRNNGEPFLHAAWIGKVAPQPGETVSHVGAGTGYYTAILSGLVSPGGKVFAYEIDADLAARAAANLRAFANVETRLANAVTEKLPPSDVIYVNAGVVAPPPQWLEALKPGGRLIFPWRPAERIGLAVMVTRRPAGFAVDPFMRSWFIPCVGASIAASTDKRPSPSGAEKTRSVWLASERSPDKTATAIFGEVWFSTETIAGE